MNILGLESRSIVVSQNYLVYPADIVLHWPGQSILLRELKRIWAIVWHLPRYDVVHYNAGTTLASAYSIEFKFSSGLSGVFRQMYAYYLRTLQRLEWAYVQLLGKPVFVTFQGDDARQGDYCRNHYAITFADYVESGYYCEASDNFKRSSIEKFTAYACGIYALNPDILNVLPAKASFVPYGHVFLDECTPVFSQDHSGPLRILHAPSHRGVKGTDLILNALNNLREEGFNFELILVEGLNNAEAKKIYERADILIDQVLAGWYGGLAVELMALGKPVLAYIRESDMRHIDEEMRKDMPLVNVDPFTLMDELKNILSMRRSDLVNLGVRSRLYVEKWHNPIEIAARIKNDYELALKSAKGK